MQRCLRAFITAIGFVSTLLSGCATDTEPPLELRVFAAISLTDALGEIGAAFTEESGVKVYYNFAASTTLQRQLQAGASADIFISASPHQVQELETEGLLETAPRHDLLTNRLVLVSNRTAGHRVETLETLTGADISRIAIGHPDIVPAGLYAKEALTHFGLWETLQPKLIFGLDVRATLAYVAAGNVDVAIVYRTDITVAEGIEVLYTFPESVHTPIVYPAVVLKRSQRQPVARRFMVHLRSEASSAVFEKHGFTVLTAK